MKFPMIKKLGLRLWDQDNNTGWVKAEDLEAILQSAQVVYGVPGGNWCSEQDKESCDNYRALLLAVEPLKKKTKAEAALEFMQIFVEQKTTWHSQQAWEDAKRILEMKDEE